MNPDVLESYRNQRRIEARLVNARKEQGETWAEFVEQQTKELNDLLAKRDAQYAR